MTASNSSKYSNILDSNIDLIILNENIIDIPQVVEALVNSTGKYFEHASGVAAAITRAAGQNINIEYKKFLAQNRQLDYGRVHQTPAFNIKHSQFILHVKSPNINKTHLPNTTKSINEATFYNLLHKAFVDLNLASLATPLVGTGNNGIDPKDCVNDFMKALFQFLNDFKTSHKKCVYIVNNDTRVLNVVNQVIKEQLKGKEKPSQVQVKSEPVAKQTGPAEENCVICMDKISDTPEKLDKCGHTFCKQCINDYFKNVKQICPICMTVYGISQGNQPTGTMSHTIVNRPLPGFDPHSKTIQINYSFPSGRQASNHPQPGRPYAGTQRTAYLPDTQEGRNVLSLLQKAFDYKLTFTIGQSRTNGQDNVITWNDIHHKTNIDGGVFHYGYPDPTYLKRVVQELAARGIV
jgi:deltex-like protein